MSDRIDLINALSRHQGAARGITAQALARELKVSPRRLRKLISEARDEHGIAICGKPATGYYMATTPEELAASCAFLEARALKSLRLASRMKNVSLPALLGQLALKT